MIVVADRDDVEAASELGRMVPQIVGRGRRESALLVDVDGFRRGAETGGGSESDLDEHQYIPLAHHQVDLTASTAVVAFQQSQPTFLQVGAGEAFRIVAALCRPVSVRYRQE